MSAIAVLTLIVFPITIGASICLDEASRRRKEDKEEIKREVEDYIRFEKFCKMMRDTDLRLGE